MAKINRPVEPVSGAFTSLTKPITPDDLASITTPSIISGLGNNVSDINLDEFEGVKNNFLSGDDAKDLKGLEQTRYDNQSTLGLIGKGLGNIGTTLLSEVAKMPGYLGGFTADVFSGNAFGGDFSNTIDNFWLNGVAYVKENTTDEWLKTYSNPNLTDAPLLEQLGDPTFWAKEGADGVGFLLSFLVPGQLLKLLGVGAKGAKLLSKTGLAVNFDKAAGLIDSTSAVFINTVMESAAEGSNAYDNAIKQGKTPEEAGEIGSNIFKKNVPVLLASNFFVEKYLMSGFNRLAGKQGLARVTDDVITGAKELAPLTTKQMLGRAATKVPASIVQEGLFEEGLQTTIEQKEGGDWSAIFTKYMDNLANMFNGESKDATDFGKAVVLGGLLGSVMGGVSTRFEAKAEDRLLLGQEANKAKGVKQWLGFKDRENKEGLVSVFRNGYAQQGVTNEELFNFDDKGNITGMKPDIDAKLQTKAGLTALTNFYSDLVRQYDGNVEVAKREFINKLGASGGSIIDMFRINQDLSNYEAIEQVNNRSDFEYFSKFFDIEGGKELLDSHIESISTKIKERYKANTGQELTQDVTTELKQKTNKYFELNNKATKTATKAKYSLNNTNDPLFSSFIASYQRDLAITLTDIDNADFRIEDINNKINEVESKAFKKGYTDLKKEGSSMDKIEDFLSKPDVDELNRLKSDKTAYEKSLNELNKHYTKLTEDPQKLYDRAIAKQKSFEKKELEKDNKEASDVIEVLDEANKYPVTDTIEYIGKDGTVYDMEDLGDKIRITNQEGQSRDFASIAEVNKVLGGKVTPVVQKKQKEQQVSSAQTIPSTEADENNYNPTSTDIADDPFYNHAKSNHIFESTGISVAYRKDGSDETFTTEDGETIPLPNQSELQRNWFQYTDDNDIDKSNHKVVLINPKYDNSSEFEVLAAKTNPLNQSTNDVFVIVVNKTTNTPIIYNGLNLVTSVRQVESKFPNDKEPNMNWFSLMNLYLHHNFKTSVDTRQKMNSTAKAANIKAKVAIEKTLGKKITDMSYRDVYSELKVKALEWARAYYSQTYIDPVLKNYMMETTIAGFTNGFSIKILDKDDNIKLFNPKESFNLENRPYELVLSNAQGEIVVGGKTRSGFKPGITYLRLADSGQIIPMQNQSISDKEIDVILNVLAQVADKPNLDITLSETGIKTSGLGSIPVNNVNFGYGVGNTSIPLFTSTKNTFGFFAMIMNWGSKSDTLSKHEIKIDKGNLLFGDQSIPLKTIKDNISNPKALTDLIAFLKTKRFHINNALIKSNPQEYYHPVDFKDGRVIFQKYGSYSDYVLTRLNTEVAPRSYYTKHGLPQMAQRNIILDKPVQTNIEEIQQTTQEETPLVTPEQPIVKKRGRPKKEKVEETNISNQPSQVEPDIATTKPKRSLDTLNDVEDDEFVVKKKKISTELDDYNKTKSTKLADKKLNITEVIDIMIATNEIKKNCK